MCTSKCAHMYTCMYIPVMYMYMYLDTENILRNILEIIFYKHVHCTCIYNVHVYIQVCTHVYMYMYVHTGHTCTCTSILAVLM